MKMPNTREISDEQEEIYMEAPMDGAVMVAGPPGTGKTVIAFLRAQALNRRKRSAQVLMYNRVLQKYTENVVESCEGQMVSNTLLSWFNRWWLIHKIETESTTAEKVYLACPFERKDEVKALGARWDKMHYDPKRRAKGQWYAPIDVYNRDPKAFEPWRAKDYEAPKIADYQYDWQQILISTVGHLASGMPLNDWGHLIIDEAQDFPEKMYGFLRFAANSMKNGGLTILADENQRLNEDENSTIEDIVKALAIEDDRRFLLTENFRNTRPIAELASYFYVGLPTGQPTLPRKLGEKPQMIATVSLDQQVDYMVKVLKTSSTGEVGVFAQNDSMRKQLVNKLQHRLRGFYRVQTYSSKDEKNCPVDDLVFDTTATVTVINRQSCKGLEFDTVFIPEIQTIPLDGSNLDAFKMNMYVMCSRAREELYVLYSSQSNEQPDIVGYFPDETTGLMEIQHG